MEKLLERLTQIISLGKELLTNQKDSMAGKVVDSIKFYEFRSSGLSLIKYIYGIDHPIYNEFNKEVENTYSYHTVAGLGILKSVKSEIEQGLLYSIREIVTADIFTDFIEMAEYLLENEYKDAAAVLVGGVLEGHLRQLCEANDIEIVIEKGGRLVPRKTEALNTDLYKENVINKQQTKNITAWLELRNKAAHGHYEGYTLTEVQHFILGVKNFIMK